MFLLTINCWLYFCISFGYSLSKIFLSLFSKTEKINIFKKIKLKRLDFKTIVKITTNFLFEFIINWFIRIGLKFLLLFTAVDKTTEALIICRRKFKSTSRFKRKFFVLKSFLVIFWKTILVLFSFINEVGFLSNMQNWVIYWMNFMRLLTNESILITGIVYFLYLIFISIFSIIIGFLCGLHKHDDSTSISILLLLLKIIYSCNSQFNDILLRIEPSIKIKVIEPFFRFPPESIEKIDSSSLKVIFKEPEKISLPFPIIEDPILIETNILWDEPVDYKFQLFEFYQSINEKVKH